MKKRLSKKTQEYIDSLLETMRLQDSNSFAAFYASTADSQYKMIFGTVQDAYRAQDLLQTLYCEFFRHISQVEDAEDAMSKLDKLRHKLLAAVTHNPADKSVQGPSDSKYGKLRPDTAELILQSTLDQLSLPPATIPLAIIKEYESYRGRRYTLNYLLIVLLIAFVIIIPLLFMSPQMDIIKLTSQGATTSSPLYQLKVKSILPVKSVEAKVGDTKMPVTQDADNVYTIEATKDGKMTVKVRTIGRSFATQTLTVTAKDRQAPKLVNSYYEDGMLVLIVTDKKSGVYYSKIHAQTAGGEVYEVRKVVESEGKVMFDYPQEALQVEIPDLAGNVLHLTMKK